MGQRAPQTLTKDRSHPQDLEVSLHSRHICKMFVIRKPGLGAYTLYCLCQKFSNIFFCLDSHCFCATKSCIFLFFYFVLCTSVGGTYVLVIYSKEKVKMVSSRTGNTNYIILSSFGPEVDGFPNKRWH